MLRKMLFALTAVLMPALASATPLVIDDFQGDYEVEVRYQKPLPNYVHEKKFYNTPGVLGGYRKLRTDHNGFIDNNTSSRMEISSSIYGGNFDMISDPGVRGRWLLDYFNEAAAPADLSRDGAYNTLSINFSSIDVPVQQISIAVWDKPNSAAAIQIDAKDIAPGTNNVQFKLDGLGCDLTNVTHLQLFIWGNYSADYRISDITMVNTPEPATLCLLAAGGIGMLVRRRKKTA